MRVLIACEESQVVCKAFRSLGHDAYSCDIQDCSGGHPEWHIKTDARTLLQYPWDLIIAHPPCTYLCNASSVRLRVNGSIVQERMNKAIEAKEFFLTFLNADCPRICVENPTPGRIHHLPPCSQVIQPWMFGDPYSKRTLLWLKGLPILMASDIIYDGVTPWVNGGSKDSHGNYRKFPGRCERDSKTRSKTFPGIAMAMASQWGSIEVCHGC